jgi:hypothetical protein
MSKATENLEAAQRHAMAGRPKVGGFPYLTETLRRAEVTRNFWSLPACQSIFLTDHGPVVIQGPPLLSGTADVPPFNRADYGVAHRSGGKQHLPGVSCRLVARRSRPLRCRLHCPHRRLLRLQGEEYIEAYPAVDIG